MRDYNYELLVEDYADFQKHLGFCFDVIGGQLTGMALGYSHDVIIKFRVQGTDDKSLPLLTGELYRLLKRSIEARGKRATARWWNEALVDTLGVRPHMAFYHGAHEQLNEAVDRALKENTWKLFFKDLVRRVA